MVANSPHYSPYFKSSCPSDHNVIFYAKTDIHNKILILLVAIPKRSMLNPLGTGDLTFYQSQGLSTFWGVFIFDIKPVFYLSW